MLLLAVIPRTPHTGELLDALYSNAGISGLGLLLTAIVQTGQKSLSLFHALFILHMLFFLGTGASPMGKYSWTRSRVAMGVFVQFASVIAFTGWGLFLWVNVKDYGSQPECNDRIKYVVLFFTIRATAPWLRGLWIATLVCSAVGLMVVFGFNAVAIFVKKHVEGQVEEADSSTPTASMAAAPGTHAEAETETGTPASLKPWYFSISWTLLLCARLSFSPIECSPIAAQLGDLRHGHAGAYREWPNLSDVANSHPTEQVHRNAANVLPGGTNAASGVVQVDDSWAFGQVLSVVMIIANINEVVHFFFGFLARRRSRTARERQAQEEGAPHQAEGRPATPTYRPRGPYLAARDASPYSASTGFERVELQNIGSFGVSESTVGWNMQSHDEPFSALR
ncbi:hypothetical protein BC826DRAFT_668700 [Russula brevipes]|nr:hypothetical protein BC826DRAFT_668700 [Russula brevipes]